MTRSRTGLLVVLAAALVAGCSNGGPTGTEGEAAEPQFRAAGPVSSAESPPDLSGAWNWSTVELLRMPRWFVQAMGPVLNIVPEGSNTHARCESAGSMTLVQAGSGFEGTALRTSNACETTGGQVFSQPSGTLAVADGRITGRSIRFSFHSATVLPCPHHAVISGVEGGVAAALYGSGRCRLPGHPQSESPVVMEPPPGGTSTTVTWQASRP